MSQITSYYQIIACYCSCSFVHIKECTNFFPPRGHITGSSIPQWHFCQ